MKNSTIIIITITLIIIITILIVVVKNSYFSVFIFAIVSIVYWVSASSIFSNSESIFSSLLLRDGSEHNEDCSTVVLLYIYSIDVNDQLILIMLIHLCC